MKAYLPSWILWIVIPALLLMWAVITYSIFAGGSVRKRSDIVRWLLATLVLVLVGVMLWLMASGLLPAFVIENQRN